MSTMTQKFISEICITVEAYKTDIVSAPPPPPPPPRFKLASSSNTPPPLETDI